MIYATGLAAIAFYLASSVDLFRKVRKGFVPNRPWGLSVVFVTIALVLHTLTAYPQVVLEQGYNFSFFQVSSLIFLVISFMGLLTLLSKQPVHSLLLVLFPLAAIAVACSMFLSSNYTPRNDMQPGVAAHVLLSVVSLGLLTAAALQSVLLFVQMQQLKRRQTHGVIEALPPLQTMEWLLFRILMAGLVCLSLALILGGIYVDDLFAQNLAHKTIFSIAAWIVFAALLWGRYRLGWRGLTAVKMTLTGLVLLTIGFFGTKLVLELILQ